MNRDIEDFDYDEYLEEDSVLEIGTDESRRRYQSVTPGQPEDSLADYGVEVYDDNTYSFTVTGGSKNAVLDRVCSSLGVDASRLDGEKVKDFIDSFKDDPQNNQGQNKAKGYNELDWSNNGGDKSMPKLKEDLTYVFSVEDSNPWNIYHGLCEMLGLNEKYMLSHVKKRFINSLEYNEAGDVRLDPFYKILNETNLHNVGYNVDRAAYGLGAGLGNAKRWLKGNLKPKRFVPLATAGAGAAGGGLLGGPAGAAGGAVAGAAVGAAANSLTGGVDLDEYKYFDEFEEHALKIDHCKDLLHKINEGRAITTLIDAYNEYRDSNRYSINKNYKPFVLSLIKIESDLYNRVIDIIREPDAINYKIYKQTFGPRAKIDDYMNAANAISDAWLNTLKAVKDFHFGAPYYNHFYKTVDIINSMRSDMTSAKYDALSHSNKRNRIATILDKHMANMPRHGVDRELDNDHEYEIDRASYSNRPVNMGTRVNIVKELEKIR